jgi:phage shock protein PspC (stress-responsive transcriptional regulator)
MQFLLDIWDRIRRFDPRSLSLAQIIVGIAGGLVVIWGIGQLMSAILWLLNIIMPFAAGIVILYIAYNWLQSRSESLPAEAKKSDKEKRVDEALANVEAVKRGENPNKKVAAQPVVTQNTLEDLAVSEAETFTQEADDNLVVKQVINPETGFKEPDITRLIEREEEKLKEADKINDAVLSQIEARRKKLKGGES